MLKNLAYSALLVAGVFTISSCNSGGFKKTKSGLEVKIVKDQKGETAQVGDVVEFHIVEKWNDSVVYESKKDPRLEGKPYQVMISKGESGYANINEGFLMLSTGDSAVFRYSLDTARAKDTALARIVKKGTMDNLCIKVVAVKKKSVIARERAQQNQMVLERFNTALASIRFEDTVQFAKDQKTLQDYFKKNNLAPMQSESGMWYILEKEGTGKRAAPGDKVSVDYTGKLLTGLTFDSNVDPQFGHPGPFQFVFLRDQLVMGWLEAVSMFAEGSKVKIFLPSALAYGKQGAGDKIGPNAILTFDMEIKEVKPLGE